MRWAAWLLPPGSANRVGRWGEWVALRHIRRLGWDVVARNWRSRRGEVDLIAYDGPQIVFIEVKTRKQIEEAIPPEAAFDRRKERKLEELAIDFLLRHEMTDCPCRFDLIAIETPDLQRFQLRHWIL